MAKRDPWMDEMAELWELWTGQESAPYPFFARLRKAYGPALTLSKTRLMAARPPDLTEGPGEPQGPTGARETETHTQTQGRPQRTPRRAKQNPHQAYLVAVIQSEIDEWAKEESRGHNSLGGLIGRIVSRRPTPEKRRRPSSARSSSTNQRSAKPGPQG